MNWEMEAISDKNEEIRELKEQLAAAESRAEQAEADCAEYIVQGRRTMNALYILCQYLVHNNKYIHDFCEECNKEFKPVACIPCLMEKYLEWGEEMRLDPELQDDIECDPHPGSALLAELEELREQAEILSLIFCLLGHEDWEIKDAYNKAKGVLAQARERGQDGE